MMQYLVVNKMDVFGVLLLLIKISLVSGCGLITHNEIGHRALYLYTSPQSTINMDYKQLMSKHRDAFQSGLPYPDAYYDTICRKGKYHSVSEDTHWAEFLKTTIEYIRKTYPPPWDEETEKLVAFMLGFASHQVADVSWHSLGIPQGFLVTMGKVDFHGSFGNAHNAGDIGGDIVNLFELTKIHYMPWYVPVTDLVNIYTMYYNGSKSAMPKDVIEECTALMFLERLGEHLALAKLFPVYANASMFLIDHLDDYFLGGMDDMVSWTENVWDDTLHMLENGTDVCHVTDNPIYITCNQTKPKKSLPRPGGLPEKNGYYIKYRHLKGLSLKDITFTRTKRGTYFTPGKRLKKLLDLTAEKIEYQKKLKAQKRKEERNTVDINISAKQVNPRAVYSVNSSYARLGKKLLSVDINHDGYSDLVISAPGMNSNTGMVYVVLGSQSGLPPQDLDLTKDANITIQPPVGSRHSKFGFSLAVVDLNRDGVSDLAVGAPATFTDQLEYRGSVYVYYGPLKTGPAQLEPSVTITCKDVYCSLGWSLDGGDLNVDGYADLVMGAPFNAANGEQRGAVFVEYASSAYERDGKKMIKSVGVNLEKVDWLLTGTQDYSWFGYTVAVERISPTETWLIVGAPAYRLCVLSNCTYNDKDIQNVGRVYVFKPITQPTPSYTLTGSVDHAGFGRSFSVGNPFGGNANVVAISASTINAPGILEGFNVPFPQAGAVYISSVKDMMKQNITTLEGDRFFDRFGDKVMFVDLNGNGLDDLLISAPLRTDDVTEELTIGQEGRVYVILDDKSNPGRFPVKNATQTCRDTEVKPCPDKVVYAELVYDEERARLGSEFAVIKKKEIKVQAQIAVSALHSSNTSRLAGEVLVYELPNP